MLRLTHVSVVVPLGRTRIASVRHRPATPKETTTSKAPNATLQVRPCKPNARPHSHETLLRETDTQSPVTSRNAHRPTRYTATPGGGCSPHAIPREQHITSLCCCRKEALKSQRKRIPKACSDKLRAQRRRRVCRQVLRKLPPQPQPNRINRTM